jgi:hypothetical protein
MNGKHNSLLHLPFCMAAITFLMIVIIAAGIFVSSLILNQNHTAIAQQQLQQQSLVSKDIF